MEHPKEESEYEAVYIASRPEGKDMEQAPAERPPAWKMSSTRPVVLVAGAVLLAASLFLNVLLLALGIVHYSKMTETLEQVRAENKQLAEEGLRSFLLYNEDLKLCVTAKQRNFLTASSCDRSDPEQHFQWLSMGLLRHVPSRLCVAAPAADNKVALLLKPCDSRSPHQRWQCHERGLLALEGNALYFNYGNNINRVVMLYSGSGPWSRWVMHGTHSNICSAPYIPFARGWMLWGDIYYFFSRSPGSWEVANQSCVSMGSHLVIINSEKEKGLVGSIMKTPSCWIGLHDQALDGTWKWVDGRRLESSSSYWNQGEPNGGKTENCALMMKNSLWYDYPCAAAHHWICEGKA